MSGTTWGVTSHSAGPRRRLRSATVNLGAVTVLALSLTGCNGGFSDDDDDDCALGPAGTVATATLLGTSAAAPDAAPAGQDDADALPPRGGFGTHMAYGCGG